MQVCSLKWPRGSPQWNPSSTVFDTYLSKSEEVNSCGLCHKKDVHRRKSSRVVPEKQKLWLTCITTHLRKEHQQLHQHFYNCWKNTLCTFTNHRTAGEEGRHFFNSSYHFPPLHRHLDISQAITAESSPLLIASSRTRTENLRFPSASH